MYNYCIIHSKEMMSVCCGCGELSWEDGVMEGYCGHCRDHAEFECWDCVDEEEEAAKLLDAIELGLVEAHESDVLTEEHIRAAVPKSVADWILGENMTETEAILRASFWADPSFVEATRQGIDDLAKGDLITLDELRKSVEERCDCPECNLARLEGGNV